MPEAEYTERQRWYREEYLTSDHWKGQRDAALERAGQRCQVCNGDKRLNVHHRTYANLGHEEPADLTVLCRPCHETFHATKSKSIPAPKGKPKPPEVSDREFENHLMRSLSQWPATQAVLASRTGYTPQAVRQGIRSLVAKELAVKKSKQWWLTREGLQLVKDGGGVAYRATPKPLTARQKKQGAPVTIIRADGSREVVKQSKFPKSNRSNEVARQAIAKRQPWEPRPPRNRAA